MCAAVALGMTGPGQTAGVSVFVDPMMNSLDITRAEVSSAYLIGTLVGAFMLPRIGRTLDVRGARITMALIAGLFGVVLTAMAGVVGLISLTIGFAGIRTLGQGALGLVAKNAVAPWFDRKRGLAMGATSAVGSALLSLVPLAAAFAIDATSWRITWLLLAGMVWAVVLPVALRGVIDRPSDVGQLPDGPDRQGRDRVMQKTRPFTRAQALREPMFWAVAGGVAVTGLISTGLAFHQIDLLGEQGLTPVEAAANFLPQTFAALIVTFGVGALLDRVPTRLVLIASMGLLALSMLAVPHVTPGLSAAGYGMALGAAGAAARTVEAASFPALFGLLHLGSIRGLVAAIAVASTAFGPLVFSVSRQATGSYIPLLNWLVLLPLLVTILSILAPLPSKQDIP
ncbi:MAG: MFS transporter [Nitriliruptoraceae bacterium]